ncbi:hypothetical protein ANCCEY_05189 [Ancylostoma ceylanicum]|uniref:Uncharacterized protein n=1 Tax=Ancylostoma ceylanicum TaxID=53326 RepID=A0A0D6M723_9BILA|nr:hypothetical protein ANCCEY_05189 [Ancylostoma ceylanicum]
MGKKRAHEAEEEEAEHQARKKVKIEIPSDINEEAEVLIQDEKPSKKKHKKEKKKRNERIKQEIGEEIGDESEDATPHVKKEYRKKARGMDLSRTREILDFEEAKRLILTNKKCGLKAVREKRHVTLPYHLIGGNVAKSCEFIAKMTVGKYRTKVGGVVVSIGSVRFASLPRVIDDQNVFHMDIFVTQAVFRPIPGQTYEARVTHIAEDFISALILEAIAINMPIDDKLHEKLKGITLELEDIIEVKHNTITIKRGICQLKGKFVRILRKGVPKTELIGDPSDPIQPEVKVKNKRKTFASDEEE